MTQEVIAALILAALKSAEAIAALISELRAQSTMTDDELLAFAEAKSVETRKLAEDFIARVQKTA